jgi:DNA repair protein RadC
MTPEMVDALSRRNRLILAEKTVTYRTVKRHNCVFRSEQIDCQDRAKEFLASLFESKPVEALYAIALNSSGDMLGITKLSQGTVDRAGVYPRELVSFLLLSTNATSIILGHNHPGGKAEPSPEDLALTTRLVDVLKPIGIRVLDHLIYSCGRPGRTAEWVSLRSTGQLTS